jgi:flavin-dependent dehydrogenase
LTCVDVAVIGAGPAGAVASRVLALLGYQVVMVDPQLDLPKVGESLPGAAKPLLHDLGLLPWLERSLPLACVGNLSAWGQPQLSNRDFIFDPHGPGWHLERRRFDACLREAAVEAGAYCWNERLIHLERGLGGWRLELSTQSVSARWVIEASGRTSVVARRLGVQRIRDDPLVAVYAWLDHASEDQRTLIESVSTGWWYCAQLPDGRHVAALHTAAREAASVMSRPQEWQDQLRQTRHLQHLSALNPSDRLRACDASGSRLMQWAGDGWLAVGDAALAFDPLSSQGIFNAIYTGMRGAQAVARALQHDDRAVNAYAERLQNVRQAYLQTLRYCYRQETRWADQGFWRQRQ